MKLVIFLFTLGILIACQPQNSQAQISLREVGGPCEGCEALMDFADRKLNSVDTLPGFYENEPRLKLTGTVYQADGITPAEGIIIYVYHTDRKGLYPKRGDEAGWGKRHGYIRGWIQTGKDGRYAFYSSRPASYPGRDIPEHIHITVKEPGTIPYYIDDVNFEDDPLLGSAARSQLTARGGSGIVRLEKKEGLLIAKRDIVLGKHIPGY